MSSKRVLIVDDDPALLRLMVRLVQGAGYDAVAASTAEEALAAAEQAAPGAAVVDVMLGEATGYTLASELKAKTGAAIVMITGAVVDHDNRRDAEVLGFSGILGKPFESEAFLALLRAALAR
jgi:DNA-binding response OmpR family regulator